MVVTGFSVLCSFPVTCYNHKIIIILIITRQLQSQVTVRELTSIETRQKVGLAIGWIDIQGSARPVI